ncbi:MAG: 4Fe-4S cluster-binding domain-containing protein [Candidatus Methanomethylicia archaeon]
MIEIEIRVTDYCNLSCKHCYAEAKNLGNQFPFEADFRYSKEYLESFIKKIFDFIEFYDRKENEKSRVVQFMLMGGEPTLIGIKRFNMLLEMIHAEGSKRGYQVFVGTSTNGLLLNENWISFYKEKAKLLSLAVAYDPFIRFRNSEEENRWWKSVDLLKRNSIEFSVNIAITRYLLKFNLTEFISRLEIKSIDFAPFLPVGRGRYFAQELGVFSSELSDFYIKLLENFSDKIDLKSFKRISYFLKNREIQNQFGTLNGWGACWRRVIVDLNGNLFFECSYPNSLGNIFSVPLESIFLSSPFLFLLSKKLYREFCLGCEYYNFCRGGCIALLPFEDINECVGLKKFLKYLEEKGNS